MGNQDSNIKQNEDKYQIVHTIPGSSYSNCQLVRDTENQQQLILKEFIFVQQSDYEDCINNLELILASQKVDNFASLVGFTQDIDKQVCGTSYKISALFQYHEKTLLKAIEQKIFNQISFSENELFNILLQCVNILADLQEKKISHQDLNLETIRFNMHDQIQIQDIVSMRQPLQYYRIIAGSHESMTYISPQLLQNLQNNIIIPDHSQYKSDVFTLGMILLHASRLHDCDDIYDYQQKIYHDQLIQSHLDNMRPYYSKGFIEILQTMLQQSEDARHDFKQLQQKIKNFIPSYKRQPFKIVSKVIKLIIYINKKIKTHFSQHNNSQDKIYNIQKQIFK